MNVSPETLIEHVFHSNWIEGYPPEEYPADSSLFRNHYAAAEAAAAGEWDPQRLHVILFGGTGLGHLEPQHVGVFRNSQVYIGNFIPPTPGRHLLAHMERWRDMVMAGPGDEDSERWCWRVHDEYESCHPFIDGNGRTGRLILNALRLSNGLPWVVVHHGDEQQRYYAKIRHYQRAGEWKCSKTKRAPDWTAILAEKLLDESPRSASKRSKQS